MKRINEYKKLFDIQQDIELIELKTKYKRLVKTWHPDKFQDENQKLIAEIFTTAMINVGRKGDKLLMVITFW